MKQCNSEYSQVGNNVGVIGSQDQVPGKTFRVCPRVGWSLHDTPTVVTHGHEK